MRFIFLLVYWAVSVAFTMLKATLPPDFSVSIAEINSLHPTSFFSAMVSSSVVIVVAVDNGIPGSDVATNKAKNFKISVTISSISIA